MAIREWLNVRAEKEPSLARAVVAFNFFLPYDGPEEFHTVMEQDGDDV